MSKLLNCCNLGCNKQYSESQLDECVYHSGEPFFHDAYKGWTCCQQKSTDFTTFLNFKGCTKGKHSNIKKVINEKKNEIKEEINIIEEKKPIEEKSFEETFDENNWISIEIKETKGLMDCKDIEEKRVFCQKCKTTDISKECVYHCGQVIFHDSLKYWTCCDKKKFTDFDDFNALKGCQSSSKHQMIVEVKKPREDFFQTQTHINIILYGLKGARQQYSRVDTNGKTVRAILKDSTDSIVFDNQWKLESLCCPLESKVELKNNKVEFVLKKKENKLWNQLIEK